MKIRKTIIFIFVISLLITLGICFRYSFYLKNLNLNKPPSVSLPPINLSNVQDLNVDNTDYSKLLSTIKYSPASDSTVKRFTRDENLFLNDSSVKEIFEIPESDLLAGTCIPYSYDTSAKIFKSTDKAHPRYGGYSGQSLESAQSEKILLSLLKLRKNITQSIGNISYCTLYKKGSSYTNQVSQNTDKILISLPSEDQPNKNVFVGLLNPNLELINSVQIKTPSDSYLSSIDPIAYNAKTNIFYFKLSGKLFGGAVNLFRIDFRNNTYKTLYQGK